MSFAVEALGSKQKLEMNEDSSTEQKTWQVYSQLLLLLLLLLAAARQHSTSKRDRPNVSTSSLIWTLRHPSRL